MKLTKQQLIKVIKEELDTMLAEQGTGTEPDLPRFTRMADGSIEVFDGPKATISTYSPDGKLLNVQDLSGHRPGARGAGQWTGYAEPDVPKTLGGYEAQRDQLASGAEDRAAQRRVADARRFPPKPRPGFDNSPAIDHPSRLPSTSTRLARGGKKLLKKAGPWVGGALGGAAAYAAIDAKAAEREALKGPATPQASWEDAIAQSRGRAGEASPTEIAGEAIGGLFGGSEEMASGEMTPELRARYGVGDVATEDEVLRNLAQQGALEESIKEKLAHILKELK
jgi:hypothetical protein